MGFSLVEILVTVIVLSIGALGAAAIQASSKNSNYENKQRLKATYLMNNVLEKIQNNPNGIKTYIQSTLNGLTITSQPSPNCSASDVCSSLQLAAYDRWLWDQELASTFITPLLNITTNTRGVISITLNWWGPMVLSGVGGTAHTRTISIDTLTN